MTTPYKEIDEPVRNLCRVLNRFPGVATYTSCGGHAEHPWGSQAPEGEWYVDSHIDRSEEGWLSLEFFAWASWNLVPEGVGFQALAKPPYLNRPGEMLFFRWFGFEPDDPTCTADSFAELLADLRRSYYVTAHQARRWPDS